MSRTRQNRGKRLVSGGMVLQETELRGTNLVGGTGEEVNVIARPCCDEHVGLANCLYNTKEESWLLERRRYDLMRMRR